MTAIATAIVGTAIVGAVASNKASKSQARASEQATDAQLQATRENIEFQREVFEQTRKDQQPWQKAGVQALGQLRTEVAQGKFDPGEFTFTPFEAPDPQDIANDPAYQFRLQQGVQAADASAAARGLLLSGAQQKALERFGQGLASQEYGDAFNRALATHQTQFGDSLDAFNTNAGAQQNRFNQLATLAGVGQTANQATQSARSQMAQQVGQGTMNAGNAIAQNAINAGNATASAYQNTAGAINTGVGNLLTAKLAGIL